MPTVNPKNNTGKREYLPNRIARAEVNSTAALKN
jgi:hypothetical protein